MRALAAAHNAARDGELGALLRELRDTNESQLRSERERRETTFADAERETAVEEIRCSGSWRRSRRRRRTRPR